MSEDEPKPAEGVLYDDPATADLSAKVTQAWTEFSRALGEVAAQLPAGTTLDLTLDPTAAGVGEAVYTVSVELADGELRASAVSNSLLPPEFRLPLRAVGEMVALGWSPPGVQATGDERFGLRLPIEQAPRLAAILSRSLREVYGTPHPAFLIYTLEPGEGAAAVAALGAARPVPGGGDGIPGLGRVDLTAMALTEKVATVIAAMLRTSPESLPIDADGDIGIRSGSAMVFVRVRDNPPLVDVYSPVLTGVDASEKLYLRLSELTHRMPIGRLYVNTGTVWASVPVFGRDFQPTHLMLAVEVMTGLADELDDRLHGEFGGKRFFVEADKTEKAADAAEHDRTGMYL